MQSDKPIEYGDNILLSDPTLLSFEHIKMTSKFDCGADALSEYLNPGMFGCAKNAFTDKSAVTFIITNEDRKEIVGYYTLSCSGIVTDKGSKYSNNIIIHPAVEIKMFALDNNYRGMYLNEKEEKKGKKDGKKLSNQIFSMILDEVIHFTKEKCGAGLIILYSVPWAIDFYTAHHFKPFKMEFIKNSDDFVNGCIPMYLALNKEPDLTKHSANNIDEKSEELKMIAHSILDGFEDSDLQFFINLHKSNDSKKDDEEEKEDPKWYGI